MFCPSTAINSLKYCHKHVALIFLFTCFLTIKANAQTDTTTKQLEEVTFSIKIPIKISGDSVSYLIDSFRTKPNSSTEDVIKKLPGIEITDGKILVQGKEVRKVFINGKEYTGSDMSSLIKNLPAETLDKIEFSDWIDERSQFTGVVSSRDEKSMNLKLKKQYSVGLTGRCAAGYGSKERYLGNLFANLFTNSMRLTILSEISNTGVSLPFFGTFSGATAPGLNDNKNLTASFALDPSANHSITGSVETSQKSGKLSNTVNRTTFLSEDSALYGARSSINEQENVQHRISINSRYKFDSTSQLKTDVSFNLGDSRSASISRDANYSSALRNEPLFSRDRHSHETSQAPEFSLNTGFQKRGITQGRTFSSFLNFRNRSSFGNTITQTKNEYTTDPQLNEQHFNSERSGQQLNASLQLEYTEPVSSKSVIVGSVTTALNKGNTKQDVNSLKEGVEYIDTLQTGTYQTNSRQYSGELAYQYKNEKLSFKAGVEATSFQASTISKHNLQTSQKGWNYASSIYGRYTMTKGKWVDLNYSGTMLPPSINQLQPVADYTDSLNVTIGNPSLRPEIRHSINLSYNGMGTRQKRTWVRMRCSFLQNQIVNKTELTISQRITTYANSSGGFNIGLTGGHSFPLLGKSLSCTPGLSADTRKMVSYNNGRYTIINNYALSPSLRLQFTSSKWYDGSLNCNWSFNQTGSVTGETRRIKAFNLIQEGTIAGLKGFQFSYSGNYTFNTGYSEQINSNFLIINLSLEKTFEKWKEWSIAVKGIDILNRSPNIQLYTTDSYLEERRYNRLGSFFIVSVAYKFNYFPGKK